MLHLASRAATSAEGLGRGRTSRLAWHIDGRVRSDRPAATGLRMEYCDMPCTENRFRPAPAVLLLLAVIRDQRRHCKQQSSERDDKRTSSSQRHFLAPT